MWSSLCFCDIVVDCTQANSEHVWCFMIFMSVPVIILRRCTPYTASTLSYFHLHSFFPFYTHFQYTAFTGLSADIAATIRISYEFMSLSFLVEQIARNMREMISTLTGNFFRVFVIWKCCWIRKTLMNIKRECTSVHFVWKFQYRCSDFVTILSHHLWDSEDVLESFNRLPSYDLYRSTINDSRSWIKHAIDLCLCVRDCIEINSVQSMMW